MWALGNWEVYCECAILRITAGNRAEVDMGIWSSFWPLRTKKTVVGEEEE